jgi:mono/diheme cytochrome c family protein
MRRPSLRAALLGLAGVAALVLAARELPVGQARAQDSTPPPAQTAATYEPSPLVQRGQYLARAADCVACHTSSSGVPYAGGLAFKLPFGVMYSSNITPDRQTGIGTWSDDDFVAALQRGVGQGGKHLYPSMPYTSYTGMSREDALAIKAYLFSLKPVRTQIPANRLAFPFNQRWAMALWNMVFLKDRRFQPDANLGAQENRGAYLATALGHCGECHTPRNFAYASNANRQFAGADIEGWRAYNITSDARVGVGGWSDAQLVQYLSTGHGDGRGSASGNMGEAVENSLQYLTRQDISALVAYLRKVPAKGGDGGVEVNLRPQPMLASTAWAPGPQDGPAGLGRHIFEGACASCHAWNGAGQQSPDAALAGSAAVNEPTGMNLVEVMLHGAKLKTAHDAVFMPSFGRAYTDGELAATANYVIGHFGGKPGQVTPDEVRRLRSAQ